MTSTGPWLVQWFIALHTHTHTHTHTPDTEVAWQALSLRTPNPSSNYTTYPPDGDPRRAAPRGWIAPVFSVR